MTSVFFPQTIDLSASAIQLIRTSLNNPKVTLDKTGLKAYDANGNQIFDIDATTGSAILSGFLESLGVIIPTNNIVPTPWSTGSNEIAWIHPDGTTVIGQISATDPGGGSFSSLDIYSTGKAGDTGPAAIQVLAEQAGHGGFAELQIQHDGTVANTLIEVLVSNGLPLQNIQRIILALDGSSDYVQGETTKKRVLGDVFRVYRNGAMNLTGSAWTVIPFDTVLDDPNGCLSGGGFKAPRAGKYFFKSVVPISNTVVENWMGSFQALNNDTPGTGNVANQHYGTSTRMISGQAGFSVSHNSGFVDLAQGDIIKIYGYVAPTAVALVSGEYPRLEVIEVE